MSLNVFAKCENESRDNADHKLRREEFCSDCNNTPAREINAIIIMNCAAAHPATVCVAIVTKNRRGTTRNVRSTHVV